MKRKYRILILALIIAALAAFFFLCRSYVTGLFMLFQQNSTQVIQGRINKAGSPALMAVFLSAFQGFAMPWKTNPRIVVASAAVFGFLPGLLLCILGRLIAVALWYLIGWLLIGLRVKTKKAPALVYGGISCFLSSWTAPLALLCGSLSLPIGYVLLMALLVQLPALGFPAKFANVYSSILPSWCTPFTYALGAVLMVLALIVFIRQIKKK